MVNLLCTDEFKEEFMKYIKWIIVIILLAIPEFGRAGPPFNGTYRSTDLGGTVLTGRYSESWWQPGGRLDVHTVINKMSWDTVALGTQWWIYCMDNSDIQFLLRDTVDGNGNGIEEWLILYDGGLIILDGSGPWGNGDPSYTVPLEYYWARRTYHYTNHEIVQVVTRDSLQGDFVGYSADCMTMAFSTLEELGTTNTGSLPPDYPSFLDHTTCAATRTLGSWGDIHDFTLTITGGETTVYQFDVEPTTLDFGTVLVGNSSDLIFTITNHSGTLHGNITEDCSECSIYSGGGLFSLGPGSSRSVKTRFAPTTAGYHTCLINLGTQRNRMVYLADNSSGLQVYDAKDPANPISLGSYATSYDANNVYVSGNYAYVACSYPGGLEIVSIADPEDQHLVGSYSTPHSAQDVHVSGDYAYVTAYNEGLRVIDISDPSSPTEVGSYVIPGTGYAYGIDVQGNYAYIAASEAGLKVINISNPANPIEAGDYDTPTWAWDVVVSGDYAYLADGWGFIIINIHYPWNPSYEGGYGIGPWSYDVAVSDDYAYLANSIEGLRIFDISIRANPELLGTCDTPVFAKGVAVSGKTAFVADGDSLLHIVDVHDPSNPVIAKTLYTPGTTSKVAVKEGGDIVLHGIGQDPGTGVQAPATPDVFALYQSAPNPFNPTTVIRYDVPARGGKVTLRIYDVEGRLVSTLVNEYQSPGHKTATWHGRNNDGYGVASGVYFYRMTAPGFEMTRKMVLLK
jgi:hypothetical protein